MLRESKPMVSEGSEMSTLGCSSRNLSRTHPPLSAKMLLLILFVSVLLIGLGMHLVTKYTGNAVAIYGIIVPAVVSFAAMYITLYIEKRKSYLEAKTSARMLAQILKSVDVQVRRIEDNVHSQISYPTDWMSFYSRCSPYLEYEYLGSLLQEFEIVREINASLEAGQFDKTRLLIEERETYREDWRFDFDLFGIIENLMLFAAGQQEHLSWKDSPEFNGLKQFLFAHRLPAIQAFVEERIREGGGEADAEETGLAVCEQLRRDRELLESPWRAAVLSEPKASFAVFLCFLALHNRQAVVFTWGKLSFPKIMTESQNHSVSSGASKKRSVS